MRTCTGLVWVRKTFPLALVIRLKEERVVHLARGMAGREVELGEIIVVAFDVRPLGDGKTHLGENGDDLVHHLADRMDAPVSTPGRGTGSVTSSASRSSCASRAARLSTARRAVSASVT